MKLTTLADARTAVLYVFGSVNARTGALDHAIWLLFAAAQTGKRDDVAATRSSACCAIGACFDTQPVTAPYRGCALASTPRCGG